MNKLKSMGLVIGFAIIIPITLYSCGGGGGGGGGGNNGNSTQIVAVVTPPSPAAIKGDTKVVISFSTSMNTTSLSLGGTMIQQSYSAVWSANTVADDTLTISPTTTWSDGAKSLTVDTNDLNGNALNTLNLSYTVDATLPVGSVSPPTGNTITNNALIIIKYNESMDSSSLAAGGSLWSVGDGGNWSTSTNTNDTLTISPLSQWPLNGQTLNVSANDLVGNNSTLNLNYTIVSGVDSDGDGSPAAYDCNDSNASIYPGAVDIPGNDVDENCTGFVACYMDNDSDGYGGTSSAESPFGATSGIANLAGACGSSNTDSWDDTNNDCNDASASIYPGNGC